jgi:hypothetical protein
MAPLPISQERFKRIYYLLPDKGPKSTIKYGRKKNGFMFNTSSSEQVNDFCVGVSVLQ